MIQSFGRTVQLVLAIGAVALLNGCDSSEPEVKTYRVAYPKHAAAPSTPADGGMALPENHPPMGGGGAAPSRPTGNTDSHWTWTVPDGWTEQGGSGMRMASFAISGDGMDCSIVALGAAAGGLGANVNRWRGQVGLESVSEEEIIRSLKVAKTADEHEALICDLVGAEQTIRAAIIRTDHETVFIKLTGPSAGVTAATPAFDSLVASFRHK